MRAALIPLTALALAGCSVAAETSENVELVARSHYQTRVDRVVDREHGVVCYTLDGYRAISCVRIAETQQ